MRPEAVVYLGPSLPRARAEEILKADYRPPVERGDLAKLLCDPPRFVGIVDGVFFQGLAVSPKELLPLLDAGVTVLGASSMGALRALETKPFGTIGVGRIFGLFERGRIDGDDEVATTFAADTYGATSVPLVNHRLALQDARGAGAIDAKSSARLIRRMKSIYYPERTSGRFWREAALAMPAAECAALRAYFEKTRPDAKAEDAVELLREMARLSDRRESARAPLP